MQGEPYVYLAVLAVPAICVKHLLTIQMPLRDVVTASIFLVSTLVDLRRIMNMERSRPERNAGGFPVNLVSFCVNTLYRERSRMLPVFPKTMATIGRRQAVRYFCIRKDEAFT